MNIPILGWLLKSLNLGDRLKAFYGAFVVGFVAALAAGAEAAGFPLTDAIKSSITMVLTGLVVTGTANLRAPPAPMGLMGETQGWGSNIKEFFIQILMAILAFFGIEPELGYRLMQRIAQLYFERYKVAKRQIQEMAKGPAVITAG